jgi:signal transduction histidine kinase
MLMLLFANNCNSQDSTISLNKKMFSSNQTIWLNDYKGWIFKKGNNTTYSELNLNTGNWEHLQPAKISRAMADENGKAEGWFRVKIKKDSSFGSETIFLHFDSYSAAADIYIDGKLFHSFGTCQTGSGFRRFNHRDSARQIFQLNLSQDTAHTIAVHYINYVPGFPLALLMDNDALGLYIAVTGPQYSKIRTQLKTQSLQYGLIWLSVSITLSFLFLLLAFQNPQEKNLWFIAMCSASFGLSAALIYTVDNEKISFIPLVIVAALRELSGYVLCSVILLTLARIFTNKIPRKLIVLVFGIFVCAIFEIAAGSVLAQSIAFVATLVVSLYYVVASWKSVKGAGWAIVIGFLCSLVFMVWAGVNIAIYDNPGYKVMTGAFLSFQLSLLVYVSIRFKEIISEVRESAKKIVEITEEKRQQSLNQQKLLEIEVKNQTADLTRTLEYLKSTQAQLIQSEKMASLGELTAGIAHEIQNPLNFVNNFSEVNKELIGELREEIKKGNIEEVNVIADNIEANQEKINHHGKRADAIVKGMLQHSRTSTGVKELTDINALSDEYLRLSYHGLKAKDNSFNATMKTDFDNRIGKTNIIPQDIGRVLLNLYNNAFYAVNEKKKSAVTGYEPTISVSTKKIGDKVEIRVKDNGNGIPQKIADKIFQPFFTTKPTGQGTGLGLSLSYDIVKAHGGEIKVDTKESEGSEFIIQLPV